MSNLLTVDQVASYLKVHPMTVRRKIAAGEIPATQLGGKWSPVRVDEAQLERWLYGPRVK